MENGILQRLKLRIWCLFKSPWRKKFPKQWISEWAITFFSPRQNITHITIIVPICNRLDAFEKAFLPSFLTLQKIEINVSLFLVCCNNDYLALENSIKKSNVQKFTILQTDTPFARGAYLNLALLRLQESFVFVCDADIELPKNFSELYVKYVKKNCAWYPICVLLSEQFFFERWYDEGTGIVGFYQKKYSYDSEIKNWGNEDWLFLFELYGQSIYPIRSREKNIKHHHHRPVDKAGYKQIW